MTINRRLFFAVISAAVAMVTPSLAAHAADAPLVKIENFSFTPEKLTVKAGTTITFENDDDIPHLVVANDKSFRSEALDTGDKYALTLTKPGAFPYYCGMHPHMQGTITVVP